MFEDEEYSHKYLYFYSQLWLLLQSNRFKCFSFRPFTTPQVLRKGKQAQEDDADEDEEEEDKVWIKHSYFKLILVAYALFFCYRSHFSICLFSPCK